MTKISRAIGYRMPMAIGLAIAAVPVMAQDRPGQIANSSVGEVGQRQTRDQLVSQPLARINSRISNRVESRIANRVDHFYNSDAQNATSAYEAAVQHVRRPVRSR